MKAYELYQQDQAGGPELQRAAGRERRQYYVQLRQAMRDECAGGGSCGLLEAFGARMDEKQLEYMYLLDAAAVWECYEGVIEGNRNTRDVGRGFPFQVKGRTLPWSEVQKASESGTLPVAVVDTELWNRLTALLNFSAGKGVLAEKPPVSIRATLQTADPRDAKLPEKSESGAAAEIAQLESGAEAQLGEMNRQLDALQAENAALREQLEQMQLYREHTREYAIRAAGSILAGKAEEARAAASQLDEALQAAVQELEEAAADCRTLQERVDRVQTELEADRTQLDALRRQEQEAMQSIANARTEREQAQIAASRAMQEKQEVQKALDDAMACLSTETEALRSLRRRTDEARKACELTQRQIEGLS